MSAWIYFYFLTWIVIHSTITAPHTQRKL